ncbi:ANTAGONIST OF LIKE HETEROCHROMATIN PROTEIN 1-like protein [Caerostris extrusa]|uniref:ANTAGONIST OF LIKE HETEROCHROMATIN PROTEIN 1-like protein n=1 Tax=Caerostris extrusa TaxID=172846 RepID=A0AAV4UML5_CAEEX|nr:ANTAGONIST OF LIKE HETEROCHROMATIN PROTEIN 1-like protein [Caerostris extrusa]
MSLAKPLNITKINIPTGAALPSTKKVMPFIFVADEALPLKNYLMRPFPGNTLPKRRIFNYRLSRARRCVENTFGIMAARFRIFYVATAVSLHNFLKLADDAMPPFL